tara:strand:+ start:224 stop:337 length:114 start_codon:yes stop_codon:yes gene_type:complete
MKSVDLKTIMAFLIGAVIALIVIYFLELDILDYERFE